MSAGPIILDYELTNEQLLAAWEEDVAPLRAGWRSRLVSGAVFLFAIYHLGKVPWWLTVLELTFAISSWWADRILMWLMTTMMFWSRRTLPCHIEIDGQGLSFHSPGCGAAPSRFEWANLTGAKKTDFAIEPQFRRRLYGAAVPWIAFRDSEQEAAFMRLVDEHLPDRASMSSEVTDGQ